MVDTKSAVKWFEDWGLTPETATQVLNNYSEFLCRMTGGKLSKVSYTVPYMETVADDYQQLNCDMCFYKKTVEEPAIPTKWIYEYLDKLKPDTAERNAVVQMFVAWRKEKEKT